MSDPIAPNDELNKADISPFDSLQLDPAFLSDQAALTSNIFREIPTGEVLAPGIFSDQELSVGISDLFPISESDFYLTNKLKVRHIVSHIEDSAE